MAAVKPDLPPLYYLDNFRHLVATVVEYHHELLSDSERDDVRAFEALPQNAQQVWLRLLTRKGALIRRDKLNYAEITAMDEAIDTLEQSGFVAINPNIDGAYWLDILTLAELRRLFNSPLKFNRAKTLEFIQSGFDDNHIQTRAQRYITALHPLRLAFVATFRLLYFGNLYQDLSEFVVAELGHLRYPSYTVKPSLSPFKTRDDIERVFRRDRLYEDIDAHFSNEDRDDTAFLQQLVDEGNVSSKQWDRIGYRLEQAGQYEHATQCYQQSHSSFADERLARVSIKQGQFTVAADYIANRLKHPISDGSFFTAQRLAKTLNRNGYDYPLHPPNWCSETVEIEARDSHAEINYVHFIQACDCLAFWSENSLWLSLFGLLYWDVIFGDSDGAFLHPYQRAPLDLHSKQFLPRRIEAYQKRRKQLERTSIERELTRHYNLHHGTASRLIDWQVPLSLLQSVCQRVPEQKILNLCHTIAADIRERRSGFPDICIIDGDSIRLREVKGPGDQLRDNQRFWLTWLNENGWDAGVVHVRYR